MSSIASAVASDQAKLQTYRHNHSTTQTVKQISYNRSSIFSVARFNFGTVRSISRSSSDFIALMAAAAENILKTGEVSAMMKQGFLHPPSSPPPPSPPRPTTLFEMIAHEDQINRNNNVNNRNRSGITNTNNFQPVSPAEQKRLRMRSRLSKFLNAEGSRSDWGPADVDLTVSSSEGFKVSMAAHRKVLAARSRFFAEKLGGKSNGGGRVAVEICDCDDVEVYVEVVALMYCGDVKKQLSGEDVPRVIGLLKVSAALMFDVGVASCLEFLEAVPWSDDEEEKVISAISHLQLHEPVTGVLQRVSVESSGSPRVDAILSRLMDAVLQANDDKARREMKSMIVQLIQDDKGQGDIDANSGLDVSKETLYHLCHKCLNHLLYCLSEATTMDESQQGRGALMSEISREADNLHWLVEILTSKKIAEQFVTLWADQKELAWLHSKISRMFRYEISGITAQLCIGIGKGHILVPRESRSALLSTWLEAFYDDFHWMKRASKMFDKRTMENGLCETILTLSMSQQQEILLRWFERFLNKGDDCPNIHRAFQVWWRRAFVRHHGGEHDPSKLQITPYNHSS